jgi:hypothetical protein
MDRYAVIYANAIMAIVFTDNPGTYDLSAYDTGAYLVADPNEEADPNGGSWNGTNFVPAPGPTLEEQVATLQDELAALTSDMSAAMSAKDGEIAALQSAVATIPTKATSAPPAVAASSAAGSVETRFALENHEHGINATQQSQISGLQSNVSSLLSLTNGLNTPAPGTATPSANSGSGSVGTSPKYAHEDHAHPAVSVPTASNATPVAPGATGAAGSGTAFSRDDHQHPLPAVVASTGTSRALETAWTPSADKAVLVVVTVRIAVTSTIGGASEAAVELRSDSASTPTTVRTRAQNRAAVSLAIALQVVDEKTFTLVHLVPAGDKVLLTKSVNTGANTTVLERVTEVVIG